MPLEQIAEAIPYFNELDDKSRDFVGEIYTLSHMTDRGFAQQHRFAEAVRQFRLWMNKRESLMTEDERKGYITSEVLMNMWDITLLHLLEKHDTAHAVANEPVSYSPQLTRLLDRVIGKLFDSISEHHQRVSRLRREDGWEDHHEDEPLDIEAIPGMPESFWGRLLEIKRLLLSEDPAEKLAGFHIWFSATHQYMSVPESLRTIKDLWRYVAVHAMPTMDPESIRKARLQFFHSLSALNLKEEM